MWIYWIEGRSWVKRDRSWEQTISTGFVSKTSFIPKLLMQSEAIGSDEPQLTQKLKYGKGKPRASQLLGTNRTRENLLEAILLHRFLSDTFLNYGICLK